MKPIVMRLDIKKDNKAWVELMQGYDYAFGFYMFDNSTEMDLTGAIAQIQMSKADQKYIIQTENISILGNLVTVKIDKDFTRVKGTAKLQVVLSKDNNIFGSWVIECLVKPSAIDNSIGESENIITTMEELTLLIAEAKGLIDDNQLANKTDIARLDTKVDNIQGQFNQVVGNTEMEELKLKQQAMENAILFIMDGVM